MNGGFVEEDERLVQVFLSQTSTPHPGIYEVSVKENGTLKCTCPGFRARLVCKHVKFVKTRIETNNGTYPLEISHRATDVEADKAKESNVALREFIIKFGKIEVF